MKIVLTEAETQEFANLKREPGAAWDFWREVFQHRIGAMCKDHVGWDKSKIMRVERLDGSTFSVKEELRKIRSKAKHEW